MKHSPYTLDIIFAYAEACGFGVFAHVLLIAKELGKDTKIVVLAHTEEAARHIKSLNAASIIVNPSDIAAREISGSIFKDEENKKHL